MDKQTVEIITVLIRNVAIPEIMAVIRAHRNATGNLPTDEQVIAALQVDADRYIAAGEMFLASHPVKSEPAGVATIR